MELQQDSPPQPPPRHRKRKPGSCSSKKPGQGPPPPAEASVVGSSLKSGDTTTDITITSPSNAKSKLASENGGCAAGESTRTPSTRNEKDKTHTKVKKVRSIVPPEEAFSDNLRVESSGVHSRPTSEEIKHLSTNLPPDCPDPPLATPQPKKTTPFAKGTHHQLEKLSQLGGGNDPEFPECSVFPIPVSKPRETDLTQAQNQATTTTITNEGPKGEAEKEISTEEPNFFLSNLSEHQPQPFNICEYFGITDLAGNNYDSFDFNGPEHKEKALALEAYGENRLKISNSIKFGLCGDKGSGQYLGKLKITNQSRINMTYSVLPSSTLRSDRLEELKVLEPIGYLLPGETKLLNVYVYLYYTGIHRQKFEQFLQDPASSAHDIVVHCYPILFPSQLRDMGLLEFLWKAYHSSALPLPLSDVESHPVKRFYPGKDIQKAEGPESILDEAVSNMADFLKSRPKKSAAAALVKNNMPIDKVELKNFLKAWDGLTTPKEQAFLGRYKVWSLHNMFDSEIVHNKRRKLISQLRCLLSFGVFCCAVFQVIPSMPLEKFIWTPSCRSQ